MTHFHRSSNFRQLQPYGKRAGVGLQIGNAAFEVRVEEMRIQFHVLMDQHIPEALCSEQTRCKVFRNHRFFCQYEQCIALIAELAPVLYQYQKSGTIDDRFDRRLEQTFYGKLLLDVLQQFSFLQFPLWSQQIEILLQVAQFADQ